MVKNSRILSISRPTYYHASLPEHKYTDSGQIYTEVTCPGGPMTADWVWKTRGSTEEQGRFRSRGPGCSTLYNMAIRSCLRNCFSITAESLEEVPWEVGGVLWDRLKAAHLDSLRTYLTFSTIYPTHLPNFHKTIPSPHLPLPSYLHPATSPTHTFLTHLTLTTLTIPRTALLQLSSLTNLASLTLGPALLAPSPVGLDDSIIRSWSRTASTAGAFSLLRVLAARSQPALTARAFEYLNAFPALAVLATEDCAHIRPADITPAAAQGWRCRSGRDLEDWLVKAGAEGAGWDELTRAMFRIAGEWSVEALTEEGVQAVDALPVLHLGIGGGAGAARVDERGRGGLRCWQRVGTPVGRVAEEGGKGIKRAGGDGALMGGGKRKRLMKEKVRQDLGSLLVGFGA